MRKLSITHPPFPKILLIQFDQIINKFLYEALQFLAPKPIVLNQWYLFPWGTPKVFDGRTG